MKERKLLIDPTYQVSIRTQCILLGIPRSGLSYKALGESQENLEMMRLMDEYYLVHPSYGVLRMQDYLLSKGFQINEKRVRRLLRLMGLMAIYPQRNLSKLGLAKYIRSYLLKGLRVISPNQVWAIDITYIPMAKGFLYLTGIIDLYSRYVVGWGLSNSLDANSSHRVLKDAILVNGKPEIINSDQGCQFTCHEWIEHLDKEEIQISMDGKGRALDNIFIERLWRSVKYDHVYLSPAKDGMELFKGLKQYFNHYNNELAHQGIGRKIPVNLYKQVA
jgi:putative transposase